jgi:hypothetical protein
MLNSGSLVKKEIVPATDPDKNEHFQRKRNTSLVHKKNPQELTDFTSRVFITFSSLLTALYIYLMDFSDNAAPFSYHPPSFPGGSLLHKSPPISHLMCVLIECGLTTFSEPHTNKCDIY